MNSIGEISILFQQNGKSVMEFAVLGGGAAGIFAAITLKRLCPDDRVVVLEKTRQLLSKVKISGGGRCNVTHACFDPKKLISNYPRGSRELLGPFHRFQPKDMIAWFEERGVELKVEEDGRMFPVSNSSQTIIDCFLKEAKTLGVEILTEHPINAFEELSKYDAVIVATGSTKDPLNMLEALGQPIVAQVPSLFTFNVPSSELLDLSGVSVDDAIVALPEFSLSSRGPVLITHWGFSGPGVLRLSAFGARSLYSKNYETTVEIDWMPDHDLRAYFAKCRKQSPAKCVALEPFVVSKSLWKRFCALADIPETLRWAEISQAALDRLEKICKRYTCKLEGKTTYKQEFVTAGGIELKGVNFSSMESKILPNVYFAGEVLDIDGVTGGFNFQAAWTTAWIAANAIFEKKSHGK